MVLTDIYWIIRRPQGYINGCYNAQGTPYDVRVTPSHGVQVDFLREILKPEDKLCFKLHFNLIGGYRDHAHGKDPLVTVITFLYETTLTNELYLAE